MPKLTRAFTILLFAAACGDDAAEPVSPIPDASVDVDAGQPTGRVDIDAGRDAAPALDARVEERPNPDAPPATLNGKRLYTVRFDSRAGDEPFACGKKVAVGTKNTLVEPVDMRFYVHDVSLIRPSGERVPLELHQDQRYQRENVALLDFVDDTGGCLTGDKDIRNVVHGYAPEQADYTGLAFKVGLPADKNHLDGASAPAPYNASGLWWSWQGGYKYARIDVTSEAVPLWYFHGGATDCSGTVATGFSCASLQLANIVLPSYDPQASLVVFDAQRFYATSDLTVADQTPGCMGFAPDEQCAPLYNTLGVTPWDDATPGPAQTAFVLKTGAALVASRGTTTPDRKTTDPTAWPDPSYERPSILDIENFSKAGDARSHDQRDPRYGVNCMRCHQEFGPGFGKFTAAGTVVDKAGNPAVGHQVEIFTADVAGYAKFDNIVRRALLDVDANGNFFTTAALPLDTNEVGARILDASGQPVLTMPFMQQTAACNNCHTGGFRLTLP
ncbi:MAG TPA: MbnP family copper-binding protein [Polyangiales bacterium]|nr:MbnP family copper-binding protein [Polyangiales bacterium]